jgi:hypothetical protein
MRIDQHDKQMENIDRMVQDECPWRKKPEADLVQCSSLQPGLQSAGEAQNVGPPAVSGKPAAELIVQMKTQGKK